MAPALFSEAKNSNQLTASLAGIIFSPGSLASIELFKGSSVDSLIPPRVRQLIRISLGAADIANALTAEMIAPLIAEYMALICFSGSL